MSEDEFFFDDLFELKRKRKGVNSGRKGKRGERDLVKILTARFHKPFARVVGSGNRWSQASLTEEAKNVLTGDLVCPANFRFVIESKYGYENLDLFAAMDGLKALDEFLVQAENDANRVGKKPLLCWKKPRSHWLAFTKEGVPPCSYSMQYRDWTVVTLDRLLQLENSFFFDART